MKCSDAQLTIGIWDLPVVDMEGTVVKIPFYITRGDGVLLLGNEILHKSYQLGPENLLVIPPGVQGISRKELSFTTYCEPTSSSDPEAVRTYLFVVPSKTSSFKSYFSAQRSFASRSKKGTVVDTRFSNGKIARRFANKLHGYSHLHLDDMIKLCQRGGVLTPILRQALKSAFDKCTSCKSTGRPVDSRKISFGRIKVNFNSHVQVDFFFVSELGNEPILHMTDVHTGFSVTSLQPTREMDIAAKAFELKWINNHGAPEVVSGDVEFLNSKFSSSLRYFHIMFEARPARRHNKLGVVERKNAVVRLIVQRFSKDAEFFNGCVVAKEELLSRATYLSNILYGSKMLSSFELVRGYTPQLAGLPQCQVSTDLMAAHEEQVARRALRLVDKGRQPHAVKPEDLARNDKVYYFKRGPKFGTWELGFVRAVEPHFVSLSSKQEHQGKPIRAAFEDIRRVPESSLLRELDEMDFIFPRSYSVVDEDNDDVVREEEVPLPPPLSVPLRSDHQAPSPEPRLVPDIPPPSSARSEVPMMNLENLALADTAELDGLFEEEQALWACHPTSSSFSTGEKKKPWRQPLKDVGPEVLKKFEYNLNSPHDPPTPDKDIGSTVIRSPPHIPYNLQSSEQELLRQAKSVLGKNQASEFKLQFVPRWIIDKSIATERENYHGAYEEVDFRDLPPNANIISSHHFFEIKHDGEEGKLKLKCRLVPHGNRDNDKDKVRKDSATAQFPIIRLVLSTAALLGMSIGTIDIKSAYMQGGSLPRDIFMRPPKGWASSHRKVWKILKPVYGIVESGRLWQLTVEKWMSHQGILEVPGLPQLFIRRNRNGTLQLAIAKVVDDFLIVGIREKIEEFHEAISKRFKVGRFVLGKDLIFNRLHISQDEDSTVHVNMQEYLDQIAPLETPRQRRKEAKSKCTDAELTAFLGLTGSLNFLGHGTLPQAAFAASHLQQKVGNLLVQDLTTANKVLAEIKSLSPSLRFQSSGKLDNPSYLAFSDASQGSGSYGQTGYISGVYLPAGGENIFHALDWLSCKQSRVSFSSIGAEILAAATSADRGSLMSERITALHNAETTLPFVLTVDSHGLYSTVTTLHEGSDYRLRPTVARMRDSFEVGEIGIMQWIPGRVNLADALTKRNVDMYGKLNEVMRTGFLDDSIFRSAKRVSFDSM